MNSYDYIIRCDLAIQNKSLKNTKTSQINNITIKRFLSAPYNYTNIIFNNIETNKASLVLKEIFQKELLKYLRKYKLKKTSAVLTVGLGNKNIVSDSLGIETLAHITATRHLKDLTLSSKLANIATFIPGVTKDTGYSAYKSIKALKNSLKPDYIIIIDSLITDDIKYLNKLIQITDRGITPGSGINNYGEEISFNTLGIPVIVIGIPTAIEASSIIRDALNSKERKITFKEGYDLIVSSKEVDVFVRKISKLIGNAINDIFNTSQL